MREKLLAEGATNDRTTDLSIETHIPSIKLDLDEVLAYAFAPRCIDRTIGGAAASHAAPGDPAECLTRDLVSHLNPHEIWLSKYPIAVNRLLDAGAGCSDAIFVEKFGLLAGSGRSWLRELNGLVGDGVNVVNKSTAVIRRLVCLRSLVRS